MSEDQQTYQRGTTAAIWGLAVQVAVALALMILWLWAPTFASKAAMWHGFGGLGIWLVLWVVYQQHKLERLEAIETEQLAKRHGTDSSIFETTADDLAVARKRLERLYRWALPGASILTALYLLAMGAWLLKQWMDGGGSITTALLDAMASGESTTNPMLAMFLFAGLTFITFIVSRYVAGMAKLKQWQLLRGGSGYLMGSVLVCFAMTVAWGMVFFEKPVLLQYLGPVVPGFMILIGLEMGMNIVLDLYRPRKPGEVPRPAFDSRVLSLLTTPESIAQTINEAINYQFGFEITRSWFWQLFTKAAGYLVLIGIVVLMALSTIVVVEPDQQAIVTRFGRLETNEPLGPGLHFKLPWPICSVEYVAVSRVQTLQAGPESKLKAGVPVLWSNEHIEGEVVNLIVAAPQIAKEEDLSSVGKTPSVSLVNAEIEVHYKIKDLMTYVKTNQDARALLSQEAQNEAMQYLFQHNIDELIGPARVTAGAELKKRMEGKAEELGIEILQVTVMSIHPPQQAAAAFDQVVTATQTRLKTIQDAERTATETLSEAAGTADAARALLAKIEEYEQLRETSDGAAPGTEAGVAGGTNMKQVRSELDAMLLNAGGEAYQKIAEARADRWKRENEARAAIQRFEKGRLAMQIVPDLYRMRLYLDVLSRGLGDARKYILLADQENLVLRFDLKDTPNIFGGLGGGGGSQ